MLQKAFLRATSSKPVDEVLVVTNRDLYLRAQQDIAQVNAACTRVSWLLEPVARNTAAAIAAAATHVVRTRGEDCLMLVLPADHLTTDQPALAAAVVQAAELAAGGKLVAFGIEPDEPETGYGYIEYDGYTVRRFVEKPSRQQAIEYLASGRFLWNSGMFCFRAGTLVDEMRQLCPDVLDAAQRCVERSTDDAQAHTGKTELDAELFARIPEDSIDYAVMEKSARVAVVPCDIGWSDIGSWVAMGKLVEPDERGNRVVGDALLHEANNCYVQSDGRLIGLVGVDDLIVVDTPDAMLVTRRDQAQSVKQLYNTLKAQGSELCRQHLTVHRPWGVYTVLEGGAGFKIKRIEVKPGAALSLQMHHHRSEHWIVVSGTARVVNGEQQMLVHRNESTYIPAGHQHRLENPGVLDLVMIEVQVGEYLGEDDIVRFQDIYGRC